MSDMSASKTNTNGTATNGTATAEASDTFVWTVRAAQADGSIDDLQDRVIWDAAEKKLSIEYAKADGTFEPAKELAWCDHSSGAYTVIVSQRLIVDLDENGKADNASGDHPYHLGDDGNAIISTTKGTDNWALSSKPDSWQRTSIPDGHHLSDDAVWMGVTHDVNAWSAIGGQYPCTYKPKDENNTHKKDFNNDGVLDTLIEKKKLIHAMQTVCADGAANDYAYVDYYDLKNELFISAKKQ